MRVQQRPHLHRDWIDNNALEIVERLQRKGFTTYLVGGCVRDLLAGFHPKDFDIVTNALPEDVKRIIPRAYVIGRRFRLVLVRRGNQQYEVATFRREAKPEEISEEFPTQDNIFGTPEQDAARRDFTINGLFYDPVGDELIDFCSGIPDINNGVIRMIGDPEIRLTEDPIRILRALRLSHKLGFSIEPTLRSAMQSHASDLLKSVLPRRREEILKILKLRDPLRCFHEAHDLGVLKFVSPTLSEIFDNPEQTEEFMVYFERFHHVIGTPEEPAELFAGMIFPFIRAFELKRGTLPPDLLEDPEFKKFFRDELGMSNYEQGLVVKAFEFQSVLKNVEKIKKRGERRRMAVLANEAFTLALIYAKVDHWLGPSELHFWQSSFEEARGQLRSRNESEGGQRRNQQRRRRPRRRTPRTQPKINEP
jgi:poly(A) polymerase